MSTNEGSARSEHEASAPSDTNEPQCNWSPSEVTAKAYPPRSWQQDKNGGPTAWQKLQAERKAAQEARNDLRDVRASAQDDPGDADTIKGSVCDDLGNETVLWPAATDAMTDAARVELRRCADAFENTARRLREIVGE